MLSPLLYSLFTHDCVAKQASNSIIKFADDTTVVGLITNNKETAYWEEVKDLGVWCPENNLSLSVNKTKQMIVDFRKQQREQPPIHIDGIAVEKVENFKFLGIHITNKLKWSTHTDIVVKKAQLRLFTFQNLPWSRFSIWIFLYFAPFIFPSLLTSLPVSGAEKLPHSMMLPPPCFTVGMVLGFCYGIFMNND